jgi:hypothetical protein
MIIKCVISALVSSLAGAQNSASSALPKPPAFATVTAVMKSGLDSESCKPDAKFEAGIFTEYRLGGKQIPSETSSFEGQIVSCNRTSDSRLQSAVIKLNGLIVKAGSNLPVEVVLLAVGPELRSPLGQDTNKSVFTNTNDLEAYNAEAEAKYRKAFGLIPKTSRGVIGIKNLSFQNAVDPAGTFWVFTGEQGGLRLQRGLQLLVRFRLAEAGGNQQNASRSEK